MNKFPATCLVDTNVPKTANLANDPPKIPDELFNCVQECVEAVEHIVKNGGLVLDDGDEIFNEYRNNLSLRGQPGVGDRFMKWVHDHRWSFPPNNRVNITKKDHSYVQFPNHSGLADFDNSDRKFIAVANAHPDKPPILQATDSKWWAWNNDLKAVGITVQFLCKDYVIRKCPKSMIK